jgi:hypothetical protein
MHDLEKRLTEFNKIVSPDVCNQLAKRCGFIQRSTSQLEGYEFAQAMMIPNAFLEAETLNSLAVRMKKINPSCNLSAPALAQRINSAGAKAFMKACFEKVLTNLVKKDLEQLSDLQNLSMFNRVLIEDSTKMELNEKLSLHFQGAGGLASKAGLKIDFIFDYLSEKFVDIEFCSANIADQTLAARLIGIMEKNDLILRDLGYYALARIIEIEEQGAYYISRLRSNLNVYESKDSTKPLDLAKFLDKRAWQGLVDVQIFIGEDKYSVRLIACELTEEAVNKRLRNAHKTAKRHGTTTSKKKLNLLKYCLFITNISEEIMSGTSVMATYRARWRIELIFKQWKSCLKLHIFKGYNKDRLLCFLYGRLIMILLLGSICPAVMRYAFTMGRELSCYKLINYLIADHALARAFQEGRLHDFVKQLYQDLLRRLCMDKRKRHSLRSNVKRWQSYYNDLEIMNLQKNTA